jgi:hypothetical protein
MKTNKKVYAPGEAVEVNISGAPCMKNDWVGIYAEGLTPKNEKCPTWLYCNKTPTTLRLNASGSTNWTAPLPEGTYFVGYFIGNGYTEPFPRISFTIQKDGGSSVAVPQAETPAAQKDTAIYRIDGQKVEPKNGQLPHGIYIQNGKKRLV